MNKLAKYIDHTSLKPNVNKSAIIKLCKEAIEYKFFSVCVASSWVKFASKLLNGTKVKVTSVVGFPLGSMSTKAKVFEAKQAIADGANEIDMVINIGKYQDGEYAYVQNEIAQIKNIIGKHILKVIFETSLIEQKDIKILTKISIAANADFVKTSTGFATRGATFEDVETMVNASQGKIQVKASGGVKTPEDFKKYLEIGATRIGTSSSIALISGNCSENHY